MLCTTRVREIIKKILSKSKYLVFFFALKCESKKKKKSIDFVYTNSNITIKALSPFLSFNLIILV